MILRLVRQSIARDETVACGHVASVTYVDRFVGDRRTTSSGYRCPTCAAQVEAELDGLPANVRPEFLRDYGEYGLSVQEGDRVRALALLRGDRPLAEVSKLAASNLMRGTQIELLPFAEQLRANGIGALVEKL